MSDRFDRQRLQPSHHRPFPFHQLPEKTVFISVESWPIDRDRVSVGDCTNTFFTVWREIVCPNRRIA
jgi:hypothetical protein